MVKKKEYTEVDFEMFVMPFGKHAQKTLIELPADYIIWMSQQDDCPPVLREYAELYAEELEERKFEESGNY